MTLEDEILDSLQDLKYPDFSAIETNVSLLTDLKTFSTIISWISNQLQTIVGLESFVNQINDESDLKSFGIELNSLLREINCPLIDSSVAEPFHRLAVLNSLCGELLSSRINCVKRIDDSNKSMCISMTESQPSRDLKTILMTLGLTKPPKDISSEMLLKKIKDKTAQRLTQQKQTIEDSLLLPQRFTLSPIQWKTLETINEELNKDYTIRREMLLRRCDCTVRSFTWRSDIKDSKDIEKQINELYANKRSHLLTDPNVSLAEALAARQSDCDSLINGVVSNKPTNCLIQVPQTQGMANKCLQQLKQVEELHKYIIGSVPDRGGRPNEQPKPVKETFSQQQFQRDNPQRGRGRGRGGYTDASGSKGYTPNVPQNTNRIQGTGWAQNTGDRYTSGSGYNQRGHQQNYDNYHNQQRRDVNNDYSYQSQQQYQQQPQRQQQPQHYGRSSYGDIERQYIEPNQSYNYSDNNCGQTYYDNNRQYEHQSHRGRGGRGRRY